MNELIVVSKEELRKLIREEVSDISAIKTKSLKTRYLMEEAAEYLSMPVSSLRRHRHRIGGSKMGKRWTFTQRELDRFVEVNKGIVLD